MHARRRLLRTASTVALLTAVAACAPTEPTAERDWQVAARPASPAAPGSMGSNLHTGADGRVYLSWIEKRDAPDGSATTSTLRFATLDGERWSEPRTIASGDDWFVNWADFPAMAALADGTLVAHWLRRNGEATYAYEVVVARSLDGGASWSEPVVLHDDGTETEHGFVSIVPADADSFHLVWLDGRHTGGSHGHGGGDGHGSGGAMTLRAARLMRDGTIVERTELDPRVCDCCQTDAATTREGELSVAYRDRGDDERRDISLVRRDAGGSWGAPSSLHDDGWLIPACPVNGPGLASAGETTVAAWFTSARNEPQALAAFSDDGGRSFGAPIRIDDGPSVGRVDAVALDDGSALVSWVQEGAVLVRRVARDGATGEPIALATTGDERASGFPRLARQGDAVVATWTVPGEPMTVETAVLRRESP